MIRLLDVNVLLALVWQTHVQHRQARNWFASVRQFATCPITQLAFLRISSTEALAFAVELSQARSALADVTSQRGHQFWPDINDALSGSVVARGPQQLTDAYLADLAKHNGGQLATFDQGIASLPGVDPKNLEILR
jgi:toxin-antitoxin system PIN domain toxin